MLNPAFYQNTLTRSAASYRVYSGAVFITIWQVKQQICHLADAERLDFFRKFRPYTMQVR